MIFKRTVLAGAIQVAIAAMAISAGSAHAAPYSLTCTASGTSLNVGLTVDENDDGQSGELYVAGEYGGQYYFHNGSGWTTAFEPYYQGVLANQTINLSGVNLAALSGAKIIVGYGRDASDMMANGKFGRVATVPATVATASLRAVEFTHTAAPENDAERASVYTRSALTIDYRNGTSETRGMQFRTLYNNIDQFGGVYAGQVFDKNGTALADSAGVKYVSETPDANTLLDPIVGTPASPLGGNPLYLVTHFEYQWTDSIGTDLYGKLPMTMKLAALDQNTQDGTLTVNNVGNISFATVGGLWIPCAGSHSPWNTHLGSEEYEPDARCIENSGAHPACASSATNSLAGMDTYLGATGAAKAYNYGLTPEVTVNADGTTSVVKHRTLGRISREKVQVMPDNKTVYQGDDGTYNVLTMFVADTAGDLSAGTLYAARWVQTSASNGGGATLQWVKLGHSSNSELATLAETLSFSDIFDAANATEIKNDAGAVTGYQPAPSGYTQVMAGHTTKLVENLKLKTGMETAAAFLETRRYASYKGATTEFEKFEGVALNAADKKVYLAMTRIRDGMENKSADPINHIQLSKLVAGAVYEMSLGSGQTDTDGNAIASAYVGTAMRGLVLGEDIAKDSVGNTCAVEKICNPDNLWYSEKMRVLFIGEDSSTAHINNFLWAYHLDSGKLSRILSLPAGAESTGLQVVDDNGGFAYIMANYQHAGDYSSNINADLKSRLSSMIDTRKAGVGYIGLGRSLP